MIKKVFVIVSILLLTVSCSLFNKEGEEKILDTDKILFEAMESKREISQTPAGDARPAGLQAPYYAARNQ